MQTEVNLQIIDQNKIENRCDKLTLDHSAQLGWMTETIQFSPFTQMAHI